MVAGLPAVIDAEGRTLPPLKVQAWPHPFTTQFKEMEIPAGVTIAEMLEIVQPDPALLMHAHIYIGQNYIPREAWHRVRAKPGVNVYVRMVPQGGGGAGKNVLRGFLMLAVVVVSIYAPYAAPAGWGLWGANGITVAGSAVASGIAVSGELAIGQVEPPRR